MARQKGTANLAASLEVLAGAPLDSRSIVPTLADLSVADNFPYRYIGMNVTVQATGDIYTLMNMDVTAANAWKQQGSGGGGGTTKTAHYNVVTKSTGGYDAAITVKTYVNDELQSSIDYPYSSLETPVIIDDRIKLEYSNLYYKMTLLANSTTDRSGYYEQWAYNESIEYDQYFVIEDDAMDNVIEGYFNSQDDLFYEDDQFTTAIEGAAKIIYVDLDTNLTYRFDSDQDIFVRLDEGGSSGSAELESAVTSNTAVGAIPSGTTLPQGTTFTEFVQKLLISEVAPTVSFSISKSGNVEVGDSYTETLTLAVSNMGSAKKIKTIAWYEGNTLKQTDTIDSTTTGSWTYTMLTSTTTNTTFKAIVTYTKSDDTDTTVTKTASISFYYKKFYGGVSDINPSEATVEALTGALATAKGGTYSFTVSAGRICYAYPKSLGALTSIKDGNGFSLFNSFTRTEQSYTQHGDTVAYYRYVLTDATTVSGYSVTFA